jgi:hypothetical protein
MSRRHQFALWVLLATALPANYCFWASCRESGRSADSWLAELSEKFGIDVVHGENALESVEDGLTGDPPDTAELERYVPLFVREFSIYPKDFVKRSGLKRIVLCSDLRNGSRICGGLARYDPPTMYLNVSLPMAESSHTIHHEFFHLVDFADDGVIGQDMSWSLFNPGDFRYGSQLGSGADVDIPQGFLTAYSLVDIAEDKAEVFANLIVNGSFVAKRAEHDPYLWSKITATKHALGRFCPEIDEGFWAAAQRLQRPDPDPVGQEAQR